MKKKQMKYKIENLIKVSFNSIELPFELRDMKEGSLSAHVTQEAVLRIETKASSFSEDKSTKNLTHSPSRLYSQDNNDLSFRGKYITTSNENKTAWNETL